MTDAETIEKKDVVPSQYRDKYKATGGTCGDFIGTSLQKIGKDGLASLDAIKAENGIETTRWSTFNPGMQRMNLANVLRGRFLKGETITILGQQYNAKHRAEDYTGKVEDDDKAMSKMATFLELQDSPRTVASLRALFFPKVKGPSAEEKAAADKVKEDAKMAKAEAAAKAKADKADKADAAAKAKADKASAKAKTDKASAKAKTEKTPA